MKHFHTIEKLDTGILYILELASVLASDYRDATRGREAIPCVGVAGDSRIRAIADMSF
jgi:hypothetical protein